MEQIYKYAGTSFININEEVILGTYSETFESSCSDQLKGQ